MFFAKYINNNQEHSKLYNSWEQYHRDTWNPLTERIHLIDFRISGTDYKSRKQALRDIAVEWSNCDSSGLFMSELSAICDWFSANAKRYGLQREFQENGIC